MELKIVESCRIDKFLWAARFYKTRGLAAEEIGKGRIKLGGQAVKASRDVKAGDTLEMLRDGLLTVVKVLAVSEQRGPASLAQALYEETAQSIAARQKAQDMRRFTHEPAASIEQGRPTKRDRRTLEQARSSSAQWNDRWSAEL
ncbi:MAG: RNA-binding S4 domain-containing protein [Brachymonas sp.]|nr:RNA-binding S4 domain-containing protein [Brachymonas sp.]